MDSEKIGKFIAQLRKENNMTQEDLAEKVYLDRSIISKWERGIYIPKHDDILILSKLFNVSVNEIYYGERQTEENKEQVNEVTINILKRNKQLIKKISIISLFTILLLILSFFIYYFITNYNSIQVYTIAGEDDNFTIYDSLIIVSRKKCYIDLGNIKNENNKNITLIQLYYIKNGKRIDLTEDKDASILITNSFDKNSYFSYKDLKDIKNNLYIEIKYDDTSTTLKLSVTKDFTNNEIITDNSKNNYLNETYNSKKGTPKYVINNFTLEEDKERYTYTSNLNNKEIIINYYYKATSLMVEEKDFNNAYFYEFILPNNLSMSKNNIAVFTYDFSKEKCLYGECDKNLINYFKKTYIDVIFEN